MNNEPRGRPAGKEWWVILALLLLFLTGFPAIFAMPAEAILFQPGPYKQALENERVYENFPVLFGQIVEEGGNALLFGSGSQMLHLMQSANYETVIRQIFPEQWVQAQTGSLIDQFWAYFNFQVPRFELVVDMRPIKARLSEEQAQPVATAIIQGLPPCTQADVLKFLQQMLSGSLEGLPMCRPPEQVREPVELLVQGTLNASAAAMPDQMDLAVLLRLPLAAGGERVSRAWAAGFAFYRLVRMVGPWLPWAALVLFILVGILARRTFRGPLYWLGVGLLLPGLAGLVSAFLIWLGGGRLIPLLINRVAGSNLIAFDILAGMATRVFNRFVVVSALIAFAMLILGAVLLAASLLPARGRGQPLFR